MNTLVVSIIISCLSALFITITRPKQHPQAVTESNVVVFLRATIIGFVCTYFGITYFLTPSTPDILQGEPDF
jgi:hypothetical protein